MKLRQQDMAVLVVCAVWAAVVLPRMFTGRWSTGGELALVWIGGLLRLLLLAIAAIAAYRGVGLLDPSNPARRAQSLIAGGFTTYFLAQGVLFSLTLSTGGSPPYPSVADLGFWAAMIMLICGVAVAIRSWLALGLFPGGGRKATVAALAAAVPLAIGVTLTLRSLAAAEATALQVAADVAYPILDSTLLILTFAMLRLTLFLGRGSVGVVWRSLLLGFLAMAAGDVVYSFFAGYDLDLLDPVLDLLYTVSYALLARGALLQLHLLRD